MRLVGFLALGALAAVPAGALALDAPHDASSPLQALDCQKCHLLHNAAGGSLTTVEGNVNLCQSCHSPSGGGGPTGHGFPWAESDQAVPGVGGTSHRWDAPATNLGATAPSPTSAMGRRLEAGKITCSACHDQHNNTGKVGGSQYASYPVGVAQNPSSGGAGRTLTLSTLAANASPKGYLFHFVTGGALTAARFKLSHDGGRTWRGCTTPTTYDWIATADRRDEPTTTSACQPGANVPLDAGKAVAAFATGASSFAVGDRWTFHVTYPFLRISNGAGEMCVECHQDRHMYWQDVEGGVANSVAGGRLGAVTLGTTVFHHPAGQALAKPYDQPAILDATGVTQATGDANATNDLVLGAGGVVTCLTCHHPHNADSNSLTVDPR